MGIVTCDMNMSLDGLIAAPNAGRGNPLGDGGHVVHQWMYVTAAFKELLHRGAGGERGQDDEIVRETASHYGAVVMGRRMFDTGEDPWGDDPPFHVPVFVVTNRAREPLVRQGGTTFYFVTDGIESALAQARAAAGDRNVDIAGGADIVQQCLRAGVIDELQIHIAPVFMGCGVRLFDGMSAVGREWEPTRVLASPRVTHIKYRVCR